jgi:hypothetical protein
MIAKPTINEPTKIANYTYSVAQQERNTYNMHADLKKYI